MLGMYVSVCAQNPEKRDRRGGHPLWRVIFPQSLYLFGEGTCTIAKSKTRSINEIRSLTWLWMFHGSPTPGPQTAHGLLGAGWGGVSHRGRWVAAIKASPAFTTASHWLHSCLSSAYCQISSSLRFSLKHPNVPLQFQSGFEHSCILVAGKHAQSSNWFCIVVNCMVISLHYYNIIITEIKCMTNVMSLNHFKTILTPTHGKIVFHESGPWHQKGWGQQMQWNMNQLGTRKRLRKGILDTHTDWERRFPMLEIWF